MRPTPFTQSGAAIVSVLVVVSLATLLVASLFWGQHLATRTVQNRFAAAQLRWIEAAVLDWAAVVLKADQNSSSQVDHLQETWAVPVAETRLDETVTAGARISGSTRSALIAGQIFDAQGRLNLSNLVHDGKPVERQVVAFRRLLSLLGLSPKLEAALTHRLLESYPVPVPAGPAGASGSASGSAGPPGAGAAAAPVPNLPPPLKLRDLLRLPDFDERTVAALAPFVILLPKRIPGFDSASATGVTRVNVNTAPAEVIAALSDELSMDAARTFVLARERAVFSTLDQAGNRFAPPIALDAQHFSVASSFFLVSGVVRFERIEASTEALFFRGPARVELLWRQQY